MTDSNNESDSSKSKEETKREREKQIMQDLRRVLQVQKDVRELLVGIRASVDSALRQQSDKDWEKVEGDIEEGRSSLENDQYETGIVEPPKTDPTKSQWRDLASVFNAAAMSTNNSEGRKKAMMISTWYIKRATVSWSKRSRAAITSKGLKIVAC